LCNAQNAENSIIACAIVELRGEIPCARAYLTG
jgi:hypothetical protein